MKDFSQEERDMILGENARILVRVWALCRISAISMSIRIVC